MITAVAMPTPGALFGTVAHSNLLESINVSLSNNQFFNGIDDFLTASRQAFVTNAIEPIRSSCNTIRNMVGGLLMENKMIPICSEEQLRNIPECMKLPILQYAPIRQLYDEARIFGFGYDFIPEGDPYHRLINNGTVHDVEAAMDDTGHFTLEWEWHSEDPELDFDQLDAIEETRAFIDKFLETDFDPTDYPNLRS